MAFQEQELKKVNDFTWEIPRDYDSGMNAPVRFYASREMLGQIIKEDALKQLVNVACLPGIVKYALGMPDIHWGYGFPIGGVAAFDSGNGVVSPGGVGFDINCGVRLAVTALEVKDLRDKREDIVNTLYASVPLGVGSEGSIRAPRNILSKVLKKGSGWAVESGYGCAEDIDRTEEKGSIAIADPEALSERAYERGEFQLGTLGSGNHFIEIQEVTDIYNPGVANEFGLFKGQFAVMIHSGSRGLGYQVCDDFIKKLARSLGKYGISVRDRQLVSAPVSSPEGQEYLSAMSAAANYAWANRQILMSLTEKAIAKSLNLGEKTLGLRLVYDVAHNIAKMETHKIDGKPVELCVHRKGATRAFPAGHDSLPRIYRKTGQPVIIPGSMGTSSYLLAGTAVSMEESFGSVCHGAGRMLSRSRALKNIDGRKLCESLERKGISVRAKGMKVLAEEAPEAYKDIDKVVEVVVKAKLADKIARLRPIGVIKG
ncbi:RtcB family protein [bacterium]|jgi:tRNA-splicing ligase RtcB|nr:RtcB family protein [bacterium]